MVEVSFLKKVQLGIYVSSYGGGDLYSFSTLFLISDTIGLTHIYFGFLGLMLTCFLIF